MLVLLIERFSFSVHNKGNLGRMYLAQGSDKKDIEEAVDRPVE